jgi:hypothetical protein
LSDVLALRDLRWFIELDHRALPHTMQGRWRDDDGDDQALGIGAQMLGSVP